jgi:Fe-S-cluster-containing hydrogenase component 2
MENQDYYEKLAKKLDSTITGLSKLGTKDNISDTWMEYLRTLVPSDLVEFMIKLPIFPGVITVKKFAKKIEKSESEAESILNRLFENDCVMRIGSKSYKYGIHIPLLIFDVPPVGYKKMPKERAKKLAELSLKYLVDEEWYRNFEGSSETPLTRIIPVQESVSFESNIRPFEDIEKLLDEAKIISLQDCACRGRLEFLGKRKCDYPIETCLGLNQGARYFIDRGYGREISKKEAKELLRKLNKMGLVHTTENFREGNHTLICSCCPCCCSLISGITRWDNPRAVAAANFVAFIENPENCSQCEICIDNCHFNAIKMGESSPEIDSKKCIGCGVCVVNCPNEIIQLRKLERERIYRDLIELGLKVAKETDREIKLF